MNSWKNYDLRLEALGAYRSFLALPPVQALRALLRILAEERAPGSDGAAAMPLALRAQGKAEQPEDAGTVSRFSEAFYALQTAGHDSLGGYLWEHLRYDETPYGDAAARGTANAALTASARQDVELFAALSAVTPEQWRAAAAQRAGAEAAALVPLWRADDSLSFDALTAEYKKNGAGAFARHQAFTWTNHTLLPVSNPDLEERTLIGYEDERREVQDNTRALLAGHSVNNMLLYGAAGTGKSATVKSLLKVPEFSDLRIIEIDKQELSDIPVLLRRLDGLRQKFILFIDDLSFENADAGYSVLKTVLEGSIEKRPVNVAIYATSNRRHLMRETFSDRGDDEVNVRESIEERTALSERFGIRVLFRGLNKNQYLDMVRAMAQEAGIEKDGAELEKEALQWEREHASRTPRSAMQFIKYLEGL